MQDMTARMRWSAKAQQSADIGQDCSVVTAPDYGEVHLTPSPWTGTATADARSGTLDVVTVVGPGIAVEGDPDSG